MLKDGWVAAVTGVGWEVVVMGVDQRTVLTECLAAAAMAAGWGATG